MRTALDLAWCAGFYEGEGTVIYGATHSGPLRVKISSTDRDVLDLMRKRSGIGGVSGPYPPKGFGRKPFFVWAANGAAAVALLREMLPLLGERRSARALEKIALWEDRPKRKVKITTDARRGILAARREGMTYKELAEIHGVSIPRIHQICKATTEPDRIANAAL